MEVMVKIKMEPYRKKAANDSITIREINETLSQRFEDVKFEVHEVSIEDVASYLQDKIDSLERRIISIESKHTRF